MFQMNMERQRQKGKVHHLVVAFGMQHLRAYYAGSGETKRNTFYNTAFYVKEAVAVR